MLRSNIKSRAWSDHNLHDPGITLLEHLAYAISDLEYRLGFDMKDLLQVRRKHQDKHFFSIREIMPMSPLTVNDYRKMLIDLEGVRNAWVNTAEGQPALRFDQGTGRLEFMEREVSRLSTIIAPKGFYQIRIEPEAETDAQELRTRVLKSMQGRRNLCEETAGINILTTENVSLAIRLETNETVVINNLKKKLAAVLAEWVSPVIRFHTLDEMVAKGRSADEIFQGPRLKNGFLDDEELKKHEKRNSLRASDIMHVLMDLPEVKVVHKVEMWSDKDTTKQTQYFKLDDKHFPKLSAITMIIPQPGGGEKPFEIKENEIPQPKNIKPKLSTGILDASTKGRYRKTGKVFSITRELPGIYGVGEAGLPTNASEQRIAQAKQLKAYIAIFEQLLGNYFVQLGHVPELFSPYFKKHSSYFPKVLMNEDGIPGYFDLLVNLQNHVQRLKTYIEKEEVTLDRLHRRVEHLLAVFAETYPLYEPFDIKDSAQRQKAWDALNAKQQFLKRYSSVSRARGRAYNYGDPTRSRDPRNVSGIENRLRLLLDLEPWHYELPAEMNAEVYMEADKGFRFRLKDKTGKVLLSSANRYLNSETATSEMALALRLATDGRSYRLETTADNRSYFNISAGSSRPIARRIEYFAQSEGLEAAMKELQDKVLSLDLSGFFYMVEHSLLRPRPDDARFIFPSSWIPFPHLIEEFQIKQPENNDEVPFIYFELWCISPGHGLSIGDEIRIIDSTYYNGEYSVKKVSDDCIITNEEDPFPIIKREDCFMVWYKPSIQLPSQGGIQQPTLPGTLAKPTKPIFPISTPQWIPAYHDPWSFQLSFVFPNWGKFKEPDFQAQVNELVRSETPSHLTPYIHWLSLTEMNEFEATYFEWRDKMANGIHAAKESAEINRLLGISERVEGDKLHGGSLRIEKTGCFTLPPPCLPTSMNTTTYLTISFWLRMDTAPAKTYDLMTYFGKGINNISIELLKIRFEDKSIKFCCGSNLNNAQPCVSADISQEDYSRKWVHLAFINKRDLRGVGFLKIMVNGEERGISNIGGLLTPSLAGEGLIIGNFDSSNAVCNIADLRIWKKNRTNDEIAGDMNTRLQGTEPNLHGYWPLTVKTMGNDITVNENNGTCSDWCKWE